MKAVAGSQLLSHIQAAFVKERKPFQSLNWAHLSPVWTLRYPECVISSLPVISKEYGDVPTPSRIRNAFGADALKG